MTGEPLFTVTGQVPQWAAYSGGRYMHRRLLGGGYVLLRYAFALVLVGAGFLLFGLLGRLDVIGWVLIYLAGSAVTYIGYIYVGRVWAIAAWMRRGVISPVTATFEVTEDAFVLRYPHVETRVAWSGISEISGSAGAAPAWVFFAQGQGMLLPAGLFAGQAEERAFVGKAISLLNPEAQARSGPVG